MCGIAGVYLKNPEFVKDHDGLETFANALFLGIESRGKRATGLVAVKPGGHGTHMQKADMSASDFIEARDPLPEGTRCILLHTRYDTKGDPKNNNNNHPVLSGSTFVTHNGSVSNDDELFKDHEMKRKAVVDSEAIAAIIDKYGLDASKFSLAKIRGNMAIAAIDPIQFPDKLLLAKGQWMPLEVVEHKDFIVWASTRKAIEDAWGLVLGTPPKWNKYYSFREGDLWVVEGREVTKEKFEVPVRYRQTDKKDERKDAPKSACDDGGETNCGVDVGWGHGWGGSDDASSHVGQVQVPQRRGSPSNQPTDRDFSVEVAALRAAGRGISRIMNEATDEEMRDARQVTWSKCKGCATFVLKEDLRSTFAWGRMCEDCYHCAIKIQQTHYDNPASNLTDNERLSLNNWCKLENMIHHKALDEIARKANLDQGIVDWLIFRVPKTYLDSNKKMNDLAADLDDLYQESTAALFQQHGIGDASDPSSLVHTETRPPFVVCNKHSVTFRKGGECDGCKKDAAAPSSPFTDGPPASVKTHGMTVLPCRTCGPKRKQPGKARLGRFVFCGKHWAICGNPECILTELEPKEREEGFAAVATSSDGTRLCHFCARSQKGLLFDGNLEERGITVEQL